MSELSLDGNDIESGLADYFPRSFTNDPLIAERSTPTVWGRSYLRNLENALTFTSFKSRSKDRRASLNAVGEVWGGAFRELRTLLGQERTDRVLLAAWSAAEEPELRQIEPADFVQRILRALAADGEPDLTAQVREIFVRRGVALDT